jgi:hypothetical protein
MKPKALARFRVERAAMRDRACQYVAPKEI